MRNFHLAMKEETKREIQQLKSVLGCKNEEDVVLILLAHYKANTDPVIIQAVNLIKSIKKDMQKRL